MQSAKSAAGVVSQAPYNTGLQSLHSRSSSVTSKPKEIFQKFNEGIRRAISIKKKGAAGSTHSRSGTIDVQAEIASDGGEGIESHAESSSIKGKKKPLQMRMALQFLNLTGKKGALKRQTEGNYKVEVVVESNASSNSVHSEVEHEQLEFVTLRKSPLKHRHPERSSNAFFVKHRSREHRSSLDKRLDGIHHVRSQDTLASFQVEEEAENMAENQASNTTNNQSPQPQPQPPRDSRATFRNSIDANNPQHFHNGHRRKAVVGINVDAIIQSAMASSLNSFIEDTVDLAPILPLDSHCSESQISLSSSVASAKRPSTATARLLMRDWRSNPFRRTSSVTIPKETTTTRAESSDSVLSDPQTTPSVARLRSFTFSTPPSPPTPQTSSAKSPPPPPKQQQPLPTTVDDPASAPYSWWWLSGLSGDSTLPDSVGFPEPTFHERTRFNTETKRPGFKRLILAPIRKLVGFETGYEREEEKKKKKGAIAVREDGGSSAASEVVTGSSGRKSEGAIVIGGGVKAHKVSPMAVKGRISAPGKLVSFQMGKRLSSTSTSSSSSSRLLQVENSGLSAFPAPKPTVKDKVVIGESELNSSPVHPDLLATGKRNSGTAAARHVVWDPEVLESPAAPSPNICECYCVEVEGMQRIRRRSSVLSAQQAAALSFNREKRSEASKSETGNRNSIDDDLHIHRGSVTSLVARKRKEIEELDATILKCVAQSGSENPFVLALTEQRARVADELQSYFE